MSKKCVKCGYVRQAAETAPEYECPKCGVIYAKAEATAEIAAIITSGKGTPGNAEEQIPAKRKVSLAKWGLTAAIITLTVLLGYSGFNQYKSDKVAKAGEKQKADKLRQEREVQEAATRFLVAKVKAELKDPESAQIRSLQYFARYRVFKDGLRVPVEHKICGEINAKNSFGGYVGYRRFLASGIYHFSSGSFPDDSLYVSIESPEFDNVQKVRFESRLLDICANSESMGDK